MLCCISEMFTVSTCHSKNQGKMEVVIKYQDERWKARPQEACWCEEGPRGGSRWQSTGGLRPGQACGQPLPNTGRVARSYPAGPSRRPRPQPSSTHCGNVYLPDAVLLLTRPLHLRAADAGPFLCKAPCQACRVAAAALWRTPGNDSSPVHTVTLPP